MEQFIMWVKRVVARLAEQTVELVAEQAVEPDVPKSTSSFYHNFLGNL